MMRVEGYDEAITMITDSGEAWLGRSRKVRPDGHYTWAVSIWPVEGRPVHREFRGPDAQGLAEDVLVAWELGG